MNLFFLYIFMEPVYVDFLEEVSQAQYIPHLTINAKYSKKRCVKYCGTFYNVSVNSSISHINNMNSSEQQKENAKSELLVFRYAGQC